MSPTVFAMLAAIERKVQRDRQREFFQLREQGYSPARAAYYTARMAWPDAVQTLRGDLPFTTWDSYLCEGTRTYYGSTGLAAVGLDGRSDPRIA